MLAALLLVIALPSPAAAAAAAAAPATAEQQHRQLVTEGFTVVRNVLSPARLAEIRRVSHELVASNETAHLQEDKFTGSLIPVSKDAAFAALISDATAIAALESVGATHMKWMSGFVISKPPHTPSLGWHQDGWYWEDEQAAYGQPAAQLFAMYYLTDTSVQNGCLRVLPGTHRKEHELHSQLGKAHSGEVRSGQNSRWQDKPEHRDVEGESVAVPVQAGDMVIGDARVLHGAFPNQSDERRTVITIWYTASNQSAGFLDGVAQLHLHQCGELYTGWDAAAMEKMKPLLPDPRGLSTTDRPEMSEEFNHNLGFMRRTPQWAGSKGEL